MKTQALSIRPEVGLTQAQPAAMSPVYLGSIAVPAHEVLDLGRKIALALADIIIQQQLFVNVQGKKHVYVEGWTTMGAMIGVTPREVSSIPLDDGSYEGTVELVRLCDGMVVGRASAVCGTEETWKKREKHARKSMATTRATGKAFRLAFSWIMKLAGYEPTPAEEMPHGWGDSGSKEAQAAVVAERVPELPEDCVWCGKPLPENRDCPCRHVVETKASQVTQAPSVQPEPKVRDSGPTVVVPKITRKRMDQFQAAKAAFIKHKGFTEGDALYRMFLKPYPKSNHVPDDKTAMQILKEMGKMAKALELEAAERESRAASYYCYHDGVGCPTNIANEIRKILVALGTPIDSANMSLQTTLADRRKEYPDMADADHWNVIYCGLQAIVEKREKEGK